MDKLEKWYLVKRDYWWFYKKADKPEAKEIDISVDAMRAMYDRCKEDTEER